MKNKFQLVIASIVFFLPGLILGCKVDKINPPSASTDLVSIAVNPQKTSMAPGTKMQLEAIGTFGNKTTHKLTENVTWTSSNPGIASVDHTGFVTSTPASAGSVTITASSGGLTGSAVIAFSVLVSISVTPAAPSIAPGTTQKFIAIGILQDSATQELTESVVWQSSDPIVTISNGVASASAAGSSTITAAFTGITGTALLTSAEVQSISVTPFNSAIVRGTTRQFTATGTLSNFARQNLTIFATWTLSPAGIGIINNTGLAASVSMGSATVTASFRAASGSAVLTVTEPRLVSITVTPTGQSILAAGVQQFTAVASFSDGTEQDITADVTWLSSDTSVATINNFGLALAVAAGTTNISASFSGITSNQVTLTVTSQAAAIASITITPIGPSIPVASSLQFTAVAMSSSGIILEDITSTATWTSSNGAVAFVSHGLATALASGVTTITATFGNISGTTVLIVTPF